MPQQIFQDMNTKTRTCSFPNSSRASSQREGNDGYPHTLPPSTSSTASLYHDYSMVNNTEKPLVTKGGVRVPFPVKLFQMLQHIDLHEPELSYIISWQPHGRCFITHDPLKMDELLLPRFFKQKQYASFRRQLNLWGFRRLSQKGADDGAYYHELFLRSKPYLCRDMRRGLIKRSLVEGTTSTTITIDPATEPRFNCMPALPPSSANDGKKTVVAAATGNTTTAKSSRTGASMMLSHPEMMVLSSHSPSFLSPVTTEVSGSTSSRRNAINLTSGGEEEEMTQRKKYSSSSSSSVSGTVSKEYESPPSCEVTEMSAHPARNIPSSNAIINSCQQPHHFNADITNQLPFLTGDYSNSDLTPFTGNAPPLTVEEKKDMLEFLLKISDHRA